MPTPTEKPFTFSINRKSPNFEIKPLDGEQVFSKKKTGLHSVTAVTM